ncbi:DMT family transporter [Mesorhizobium sp. NPDC059025]|uniref:DMT family transporter n=1 Tax=unclassified Mesorhizobium TaxID=325217 RepID=UPI00367CFF99
MFSISDRNAGVALAMLAAVFWSTGGLFSRLIAVDSWTLLFWRSTFSAVFVLMFLTLVLRGTPGSIVGRLTPAAWLVAGMSSTAMVAFIFALRNTTVANVAVIHAGAPLIVAALSWALLGHRPPSVALLAGVAAVAGAVLTVGASALSGGGFTGDLLALAMTLLMALMAIAMRQNDRFPVAETLLLSNILCAVAVLPFSDPLTVAAKDLGWLASFGLVQMTLGFLTFGLSLRYLPARDAALIGAVETPIAPIWVWLAFHEVPARSTIIGGSIIFVSVLAFLLCVDRKPASSYLSN